MERLLKINEVSEMLQMSPKTIYHWVHCGSIPYFKVYRERGSAGVIRFRQSDLEKWLQVRRQNKNRLSAMSGSPTEAFGDDN